MHLALRLNGRVTTTQRGQVRHDEACGCSRLVSACGRCRERKGPGQAILFQPQRGGVNSGPASDDVIRGDVDER